MDGGVPRSRVRAIWLLAAAIFGLWGPAVAPSVGAAGRTYDSLLAGDARDVSPPTTGGLAMMGGGADVDAAFRWLLDRSGGGDIVVLRATGDGGYNRYLRSLGSVDSVATLVTRTRSAASDPFVVETIRNAEALFVAGGDQWDYLRFWQDTPIEAAINVLAAEGVPIGGTSAGLAILGRVVYSAERGTVYPREALRDPYDRRVTFARDFLDLPHIDGVITDGHFSQRHRLGRLVAFLAGLVTDGRVRTARGIGVDEETAVLVDAAGRGTVVGRGEAYFLQTPGRPEACRRGEPLTFRDVPVYRAAQGDTFDLTTWRGAGGSAYDVSVRGGRLDR